MTQSNRSSVFAPCMLLALSAAFINPLSVTAQDVLPGEKLSEKPKEKPEQQQPTPVKTASDPVNAHQAWLDEAVELMTGSFSSKAQATQDPEFFDIRLQMVRIWKTEKGACWLYVEQAVAQALSKPYRQRIYRISVNPDGTIRSETYTFPEASKFAGAWNQPDLFNTLIPKDLALREGCDVILTRKSEKVFEGGTVDKKCSSERGGATYATAQVLMDQKGLVTWDRGFNAEDKQVWGATKAGYKFLRVTTEESTSPPAPSPTPPPSLPTPPTPNPPTPPTPTPTPVTPTQPTPLSDPALIHPTPK